MVPLVSTWVSTWVSILVVLVLVTLVLVTLVLVTLVLVTLVLVTLVLVLGEEGPDTPEEKGVDDGSTANHDALALGVLVQVPGSRRGGDVSVADNGDVGRNVVAGGGDQGPVRVAAVALHFRAGVDGDRRHAGGDGRVEIGRE